MSQRPKWAISLWRFVTDDIYDTANGWSENPDDARDDAVMEEIERRVIGILCREYGHVIIHDQCGNPDHRYCVFCRRGIGSIDPSEGVASCER